MCSEPVSSILFFFLPSQNINTKGILLFVISLNHPPLKVLLSFFSSYVFGYLECFVFKAEMLSQGHNIMVQLTSMLRLSADYWAPPTLKAINKKGN